MNAEIGRVLGDRYRLIAPIGMGASAKVFLADDVRLLRRVALKMLHESLAGDPVFLHRFRAEAQAAAALSHPNVMAIYDWGDDEVAYIVTEYLGGGSLRAILDQGAVLSPSQALTVGLEAARALDYAHRRGFVHRDIKPANLLFGDDARLRIADFGLARALAEAAWTEPQGAVFGTARYAAPEQAKGERLSVKADVYALALVLVEAVTGEVPFRSDTTLGTLMARVDRPLEVPDALGPLASIVARAGHPDPEHRVDARTLAAGLLRAAKELPRPEPLPLVGALNSIEAEPPEERTRHAPVAPADEAVADIGPDLTEDDLDLDPPDWVSGSEPTAPVIAPVVAIGRAVSDREGETEEETAPPTEPLTVIDGDEDDEGADDPIATRRRRRWPLVLAVLVVLFAGGAAAGAVLRRDAGPDAAPEPPVVLPVPILEGLEEDEAVKILEGSGWRVEIEHSRVDGTTAGDVLGSDPEAGERLVKQETITLLVSEGQELVDLPDDLVGRSVADVNEALQAAGLDSRAAGSRHDEDVPRGWVVALEDGTPERIERGSKVGLIISEGPAPRRVPSDLVGRTENDASDAIVGVQLEVAVERVHSDDVDEGEVMAQDPAGGTLPRGGTVTITVSAGPEMVAVPDISWTDTPKQAAAVLRERGLVPGKVTGPAEGSPARTDPEYGAEVRKGTEVDIIVE